MLPYVYCKYKLCRYAFVETLVGEWFLLLCLSIMVVHDKYPVSLKRGFVRCIISKVNPKH